MPVTIRVQVTIPQIIRRKLGITPHCEVRFVEETSEFIWSRRALPSRRKIASNGCGVAMLKLSTEKLWRLRARTYVQSHYDCDHYRIDGFDPQG
jgi:bifunctional DNA-binding transcriptional regulator/antitoxin component of YhaV-PrlF toxin-antitoxin module